MTWTPMGAITQPPTPGQGVLPPAGAGAVHRDLGPGDVRAGERSVDGPWLWGFRELFSRFGWESTCRC